MTPIVKWVGGKRQLLPKIVELLTRNGRIRDYYEPMVGGGAVFFGLQSNQLIDRTAWIGDVNEELINVYRVVEDVTTVRQLKGILAKQSDVYKRAWESDEKERAVEALYYSIRDMDPTTLGTVSRAARFIFINKAGFNGLYRVNKKGKCNVPWGHGRKPALLDEEAIDGAHKALSQVSEFMGIAHQSIFNFDEKTTPEDAVYIDPPYVPVSPTADFTSYTAGGFGEVEQRKLAELFRRIAGSGTRLVLSNSDTPLVRELYASFMLVEVRARRAVNRDVTKRGKVGELLVCANIKP